MSECFLKNVLVMVTKNKFVFPCRQCIKKYSRKLLLPTEKYFCFLSDYSVALFLKYVCLSAIKIYKNHLGEVRGFVKQVMFWAW